MTQIKPILFIAAFALICCIGFAGHNSVLAAETNAVNASPTVEDTKKQTAAEEQTATEEKTADKKKSKCDCDCDACKNAGKGDK